MMSTLARKLNNLGRMAVPLRTALLAGLLVLSSVGCSRLFGPKAEDSKAIDLRTHNDACFRTLGPQVKRWAQQGGAEIGSAVDCSVRAIDTFVARTRGQRDSHWTSPEIAQFADNIFESQTSEQWVAEVLRIKQAVFGGESDSVSIVEFQRFRSLLLRLRPLLIEASPYVRHLRFESGLNAASGEGRRAGQIIQKISHALKAELSQSSSIRPAFDLSTYSHASSEISDYVSLVMALKPIFAGGDRRLVAADEWPRMVDALAQAWALALRYRFEFRQAAQSSIGGMSDVEQMIGEGFALAEFALEAQEGGDERPKGISLQHIDKVFEALEKLSWLPAKIKATTLSGLLPHVLTKLLSNSGVAQEPNSFSSLTNEHLKILRLIAADWLVGQKEAATLFEKSSALPLLAVKTWFENESRQTHVTSTISVPASDEENLLRAQVRSQLKSLLTRGRPLIRDAEGRLVLSQQVAAQKQEIHFARRDLDLLNLLRVVVTRIISGYMERSEGEGKGEGSFGLSELEAERVYLDFRQLGVDLGFMDRRGVGAGKRTFMEASLFTSVSDGSNRIDLHETIEWFYLVLSSGALADRVYSQLVDACGTAVSDVFGKRTLQVECARRNLKSNYRVHFANLPGVVRWLSEDKSERRFDSMLAAIETASRSLGYSQRPLDSSDFRAMVSVLHYVENIFAVHDKQSNDLLDSDELWNAYPILRPFISRLSKVESDWINRGVYSWLLFFGEAPSPGWARSGKIVAWSAAQHAWSESADRLGVAKIIAAFTETSRSAKNEQLKEFIVSRGQGIVAGMKGVDLQMNSKLVELLQCQTEAREPFKELSNLHAEEWASQAKVRGQFDIGTFISLIKANLLDHPILREYCLPF